MCVEAAHEVISVPMSDDAPSKSAADAPGALSEEQRRTGSQKLAALLRAADDVALQRFRRQRLGAAEVGEEELQTLRSVLEALALQLEDGDEEGWERVRRAAAALAPTEEVADEPSGDLDITAPSFGSRTSAAEGSVPEASMSAPRLDQQPEEAGAPPLRKRDEPSSPWLGWARSEPGLVPGPPRESEAETRWPTLELGRDEQNPTLPLAGDSDARSNEEKTASFELPAPPPPLPFPSGDEHGPTKVITYASLSHGLALGVEDYAALCAERDERRERHLEIHERYDVVGDRTRAALDRLFELRFMRDPSLRSVWQQHYVRFKTVLRQR
jgi:hypothetical protein